MASRKEQKEQARQARLAAEKDAAARAARTLRLRIGGGIGAAVVVAAIIVAVVLSTGGGNGGAAAVNVRTTGLGSLHGLKPAPAPGPTGPEGVPIPLVPQLASNASAAHGQTVDGIQCDTTEQTLFHVHTHLTIFVNGTERQIPYGIGISPPRQVQQTAHGPFVTGGSCFYWLHTHAPDGIIHIESPVQRAYTLGDFFDIWRQPLGSGQVGPAKGHVTAFYDGKLYRGGNPRDIPLGSHTQIQLDVGTPLIAPEKISFAGTGL